MIQVAGNQVTFKFFRPDARRVHVVGDFNGWQPGALRMRRDARGGWQATARLPAGT